MTTGAAAAADSGNKASIISDTVLYASFTRYSTNTRNEVCWPVLCNRPICVLNFLGVCFCLKLTNCYDVSLSYPKNWKRCRFFWGSVWRCCCCCCCWCWWWWWLCCSLVRRTRCWRTATINWTSSSARPTVTSSWHSFALRMTATGSTTRRRSTVPTCTTRLSESPARSTTLTTSSRF